MILQKSEDLGPEFQGLSCDGIGHRCGRRSLQQLLQVEEQTRTKKRCIDKDLYPSHFWGPCCLGVSHSYAYRLLQQLLQVENHLFVHAYKE